MAGEISEADWRVFRELKPIALDRLCARVLAEMTAIQADATRTNHQRFLAVYARINEGNDDVAAIFNGMSRSRASLQLHLMIRHGLLTPDEISRFSAPFRDSCR